MEPQSSDDKKAGSCSDRIPCAMRIFNLISAGLLIGFGIAGIVLLTLNSLSGGKFFLIFSPIFMALVGVLFVSAQFQFDCVMKHFIFLKAYFSRGIFNIFMSSSVFYYFDCSVNNSVLAWIAACLIFISGVFYIVAGTCLQKQFQKTAQPAKQDLIT